MLLIRHRRQYDSAKLLFVGWTRTAWVVGLSVLVPLGLYIVYTRLTPWGGGGYGMNYARMSSRFLVEMVVLVLVILGTTLAGAYRAIRARCKEAGMPVPEKGHFRPGWFWGGVGLACLITLFVYARTWRADRIFGLNKNILILSLPAGFTLAPALAALALAWAGTMLWRFSLLYPSNAHFCRTLVRSFLPLLATVMFLLAALSYLYLGSEERHYARLLSHPSHDTVLHELEMSLFKDYRDHLAELHRQAMAKLTPRPATQER
jgi:hypothetical protein